MNYVASIVEGCPNVNSDTSFKLPVLTRQHIIDWVMKNLIVFFRIKKSFEVCAISSLDPDKVQNGAFSKLCMGRRMMLMTLMTLIF